MSSRLSKTYTISNFKQQWYRKKGAPYSNKSNKTDLSLQNVHVPKTYKVNDQMTVVYSIYMYIDEVNGFCT